MRSHQKTGAGFQSQKLPNSDFSNQLFKVLKPLKVCLLRKSFDAQNPTTSTPIPGITTTPQITTKTLRKCSDIHNVPNTSKIFTSRVDSFCVASDHFRV